MPILEKIDKLSGTKTRSRNITQAIDKLTGKGPSKNIEEAVKKMDSPITDNVVFDEDYEPSDETGQ